MKKLLTLLLLLAATISSQAQVVKGLQKGKLTGVIFLNDNGEEISRLEPIYEEVFVFTRLQIGNLNLGESYQESRNWIDSEYVEVPIDPNDFTKVRVDTFVNNTRAQIPNKPIIAKKDGKYGIIDQNGNEMLPFQFDSYIALSSLSWNGLGSERKPLILFSRGNENIMIDAQLQPVINERQFPVYFHTLSRKDDALEICLFGEYMLLNMGGVIADTLIKVPAVKESKNGKMVVTEKAYSYPAYKYKGGKFNVIDLKTGQLLWKEPKQNITISFLDPDGKPYFESLNPRDIKSIFKYQENLKNGITPAIIEFK